MRPSPPDDPVMNTRATAAPPHVATIRLLAREIAGPDGPPVRVRLVGEDLVAFRDSDGRIGLLNEYCPHRRASLWFGRNEECGLRCVYHGWKFAVDGSCVDQMNEPEENQFKHKVSVTAYPTCELGGLVWAYMGPAEKIPPLPKFAWTQVLETHRHVSKVIQECNWVQGLEGGLDTSHAPILHRLLKDNAGRGGIKPSNPYVRAGAPRLVVDITDYGYQYTGIRRLGDAEMHARTYHYILPFHQIRAASNEVGDWGDAGHAWVPIDDETTMVYNWVYTRKSAPLNAEDRLERAIGNGPEHVDQTTFRSKANRDNAYLIDRAVQKTESFTGIDGINVQDARSRRAWGRSATAVRSIWARPTRASSRCGGCCARRSTQCARVASRRVSRRATTISIAHCRYCRATPTGAKSSRPPSRLRKYCRPCEGDGRAPPA